MTAESSIISTLADSLVQDPRESNRNAWTREIIENRIKLSELFPILKSGKTASMRFTWILGDISTLKPELLFEHLPYLFSIRNEMPFPNYDRSLAKFFCNCGIPETIEGIAIDELFKWLNSASVSVSTKHYCVLTLQKTCERYPELKPEFLLILNEQLGKNKPSLDKMIERILKAS